MGKPWGRAVHGFEHAPPVPIAEASPPTTAGWYGIQVGRPSHSRPNRSFAYVGESANLAGRITRHRRHLTGRVGIELAEVYVRWYAPDTKAEKDGGEAWMGRGFRELVEEELRRRFKPEWDLLGFGWPGEDTRWAAIYPKRR